MQSLARSVNSITRCTGNAVRTAHPVLNRHTDTWCTLLDRGAFWADYMEYVCHLWEEP